MLLSCTIYDTHAKTGQNQLKLIWKSTISTVRAQYQLFEHNIYRLLNVYRKIFGTSSYGEDAKLPSASPPYERVPNILRYSIYSINFLLYYPLNCYFTIDNASIYRIQDHPAFHFAIVNVKTIISSGLGGYRVFLLTRSSAHWREMVNNVNVIL